MVLLGENPIISRYVSTGELVLATSRIVGSGGGGERKSMTLIDEMSIQITHHVSRAARCFALAGEDHAACTRLTPVRAPGMQGGQ